MRQLSCHLLLYLSQGLHQRACKESSKRQKKSEITQLKWPLVCKILSVRGRILTPPGRGASLACTRAWPWDSGVRRTCPRAPGWPDRTGSGGRRCYRTCCCCCCCCWRRRPQRSTRRRSSWVPIRRKKPSAKEAEDLGFRNCTTIHYPTITN